MGPVGSSCSKTSSVSLSVEYLYLFSSNVHTYFREGTRKVVLKALFSVMGLEKGDVIC